MPGTPRGCLLSAEASAVSSPSPGEVEGQSHGDSDLPQLLRRFSEAAPEESLNLCVTLKVGCEDGGCCCPPGLSSGPSDTPFVQTLGRRLGSACLSLEYGGRGVGREGTKPPAGRKMGFSSRTKAEHPHPLPPGQDLCLGVKINSTSTGYGWRWRVGGEES